MEDWKPVEGYEGLYEVHPSGFVRTVGAVVRDSIGRAYTKQSKVLKTHRFSRGDYRYVRLKHPGETYKPTLLHRIVAKAFIPNPDDKPAVNHKDGDKGNNDVSNLEWVTYKENYDHAVKTGLMPPLGRKKKETSPTTNQQSVILPQQPRPERQPSSVPSTDKL